MICGREDGIDVDLQIDSLFQNEMERNAIETGKDVNLVSAK